MRVTNRVFYRLAALAGVACVLAVSACGSSGSSATNGAAPATTASGSATTGTGASMSPGASMTASGSATASSAADTFVIKNFMFEPMSLTVAAGATVTVRNQDTVAHTLTDKSDPSLFNTGDIGAGQSKTFTAPKKAGSYAFICSIHQYMTGTLVVR